jgi:hypothetical protein
VQACAIATYLAETVLKQSVQEAVNGFNGLINAVTTTANLLAIIPGYGLEIRLAIEGVSILYRAIGSSTITDYQAALDDPTQWARIKCAIVHAIGNDGGITDANVAGVIAAVASVTGMNAAVLTTITDYMTALGGAGLRAASLAGGLNGGDCTGCGDWRYRWLPGTNDADAGDWTLNAGHYVGGVGWVPGAPGDDAGRLVLSIDLVATFPSTNITSMGIQWQSTEGNSGYGTRALTATTSPPGYGLQGTSFDAVPGGFSDSWVINASETWLRVQLGYDGDDHATTECISGIQVTGTGVCPWGRSNY